MDEKNNKNNLEYNPTFKRKEKLRGSFSSVTDDVDTGANDQLLITEEETENEIGNGLITNNIENILILESKLKDIRDNLYRELMDIKTEIPTDYIEIVLDIKDKLGLVGKDLTIDDYIYGLDNLKDPSAALLVELWENYHEDINGNLKAELFGDVHELLNDITHTKDFISNFLINKLHSELSFNSEDFLKEMKLKEKEAKKIYDEKEKNYSLSKLNEIKAMIDNPKDIEKAKERKYNQEVAFQKNKFLFYGLEESNDILENKIIQLDSVISTIENNLEKNSYENPFQITRLLYSRNEEPEKSIPYLHKMNLLVKLGVDNDNEEKHQIKNTIRNIYTIDNKSKIMNELLVETEVFEKVSLDVSHYLNFYQDKTNDDGDIFLNNITKSLTKLILDKKNKTKDFYNIEKSDLELREAKIDNVLEKDDSRQTYIYINELLNKN